MEQNRRYNRPTTEELKNQRPLTDIDGKLQESMRLLEQGYDKLFEEDNFQKYLQIMSRFHQYSPNNILLILAQKPDASKVASFQTWQKVDRHVKKGEQGIKIFVPILSHKELEDQETQEKKNVEVLVGFKLGNVFDVSQTEGKPLPEAPHPKDLESTSEVALHLIDRLIEYNSTQGIAVTTQPLADKDLKGFYMPSAKLITVNSALMPDMAAKTLTHETSHTIARSRGWGMDYEDGEMIAEGSAYVVLHQQGIDTAQYSFSYLAHWAGQDREKLKKNLGYIQKTANIILREVGEMEEGK
ncbi:MAG TPA: ArdC family protein [Chloroflexia bacterium]|nr:ArdC family protein [Chloroflexia bacterium]